MQRGFHDGDGCGIVASDFFHPLFLAAHHGGMNDAVQFLDARELLWLRVPLAAGLDAGPKAASASLARLTLPSGLRISRPKCRTTSL